MSWLSMDFDFNHRNWARFRKTVQVGRVYDINEISTFVIRCKCNFLGFIQIWSSSIESIKYKEKGIHNLLSKVALYTNLKQP